MFYWGLGKSGFGLGVVSRKCRLVVSSRLGIGPVGQAGRARREERERDKRGGRDSSLNLIVNSYTFTLGAFGCLLVGWFDVQSLGSWLLS